MPTMAEPQAKRLKRCHDELDDSASSSTASSVPRATYAPRKSTVSPRDTKATLLQHITHLEEEKTAAQARLEQENRLLKSLLNQPEKIPAVEEYLARFMADRNATSYHELWEDMEKVRAQNSCLLRGALSVAVAYLESNQISLRVRTPALRQLASPEPSPASGLHRSITEPCAHVPASAVASPGRTSPIHTASTHTTPTHASPIHAIPVEPPCPPRNLPDLLSPVSAIITSNQRHPSIPLMTVSAPLHPS
ncbi:uncharacterized protein SCHCODRAFT_01165624 [Schizophyllum commune H4-8]|uniref:uncharacterized protein n=1 Tax=Schizophyllum commune (strain H4-8 / FGSC 9210) TaxID=578458 RepID=UPI00215DDA0D|nr:uncharacterized protein SCHCODRAFT_01165624 [Schizophyllum commune H4-8]KAI5893276.1 hypothetical protein SCHCODRAFT_01165624 [Schizophyllum commune H4-8]